MSRKLYVVDKQYLKNRDDFYLDEITSNMAIVAVLTDEDNQHVMHEVKCPECGGSGGCGRGCCHCDECGGRGSEWKEVE